MYITNHLSQIFLQNQQLLLHHPRANCPSSNSNFVQFSLKKKKKFNEFHFYCIIDRISLSKRIHPFIFSLENEISKGHASSFLGWKFHSHNSPRLDAIFTVNISPLDQMSPLAWPPSPLRTYATLHAIAPLACFQFSRGGRLLCSQRSVCFLAPSFRLDKFISPPISSAPPSQPFYVSIH